jgi:hypothetical protein
MNGPMTTSLDTLEEQAEKLKNAVRALASFSRAPQERLDTALSYFLRTFRDPPQGEAAAPYATVYAAIGDPPVGTTVHVRQETLSPDELEALANALVDLCEITVRRCAELRQVAAAAPAEPVVEAAIPEGVLESLVPSRGADR